MRPSAFARKRLATPYHFRVALFAAVLQFGAGLAWADASRMRIEVTDEHGKLLPCRIHLQDAHRKWQRAEKLPFWNDHFVCPGSAELTLSAGQYHYQVERGPEYESKSGVFTVAPPAPTKVSVSLARICNMAQQGWWSGELHVHRSIDDIELLMRAEDLHVATVITWWNNQNVWLTRPLPKNPLRQFDSDRFCHLLGGEDEREGGAVLFLNLARPLSIAGLTPEYPSAMKFVLDARRQKGAWIDIEKPFWWDVPVWLSSGAVDSIELANNHMQRSEMYPSEAWGKPRDTARLPSPRGNGFWSQEIYYHILNCGLRIPPSAGSASGVLSNPMGYNRVYVHPDHMGNAGSPGKPFSYGDWWAGLRAGRAFVTNGPLLVCRANGKLPGHVFTTIPALKVHLDVQLTSNDPVSALQVIHNGRIVETIDCDPKARSQHRSVDLTFDRGGWFLVRAIVDNPRTFRFASIAPFYLEIGPTKTFVSRRSAQFFVDWVKERMAQIKLPDENQRREVLVYHIEALKFWKQKVADANAD